MKLLIVSNAPIIYKNEKAFAYSPYVKELIVWEKYADIIFCCPIWKKDNGLLIAEIPFKIKEHFELFDTNLKSIKEIVTAFFLSFSNFFILLKAMNNADHIHLRCPGNIGLLGCIAQIFFPNKKKTAKYAGNWDPKAKQPWSYRLQKWILSNTFLTKNMQVLVYGQWEGSTKNIKPFFTATYSEADKIPAKPLCLKGKIRFVFVGTLVHGKNPLYAIQLVEGLIKKGYEVSLDLHGEGKERELLEAYITFNALEESIVLHGNQNQETVKTAYQNSHFVILPSKSEGWPKAIAEGMFWGCVPVATSVSCVPFMLDNGERGVLLEMNLERDIEQLVAVLESKIFFDSKREKAMDWSRNYTVDVFEAEIKQLLV
ncbi:glycosyltransferase [Flavobacterium sp.]|uniref:glycosyltransferase family 4 protein n=1 Tax=Flavobacterium sp. TaxID=239 RepID=UPI002CC24B36|nr:glycosyltransferase [Flavobacterium sp.]HSD06153.1 glycosyltransferase [Flavobacterium sp.]